MYEKSTDEGIKHLSAQTTNYYDATSQQAAKLNNSFRTESN
jgi:hypothetical protein